MLTPGDKRQMQAASCDTIIMVNVLEHVEDDGAALLELYRVLKPGGVFIVTFSNRMFPTKAVRIWQSLDDTRRAELIASYFSHAGGWEEPQHL